MMNKKTLCTLSISTAMIFHAIAGGGNALVQAAPVRMNHRTVSVSQRIDRRDRNTSTPSLQESKKGKTFDNLFKNAGSTEGKAYAKALRTGKINFSSGQYIYADLNKDGQKELAIKDDSSENWYFYICRSGNVTKLLEYWPEYTLSYDASDGTIWETGEGDGGWCIKRKLKGKMLQEIYRYSSSFAPKNPSKIIYEKSNGGNHAVRIKKAKYNKVRNRIAKLENKMPQASKAELIRKLKS